VGKFLPVLLLSILLNNLWVSTVSAQERKAVITGHAMDSNHDPLAGARVELQPLGRTATTDSQGQFTIPDAEPGKYRLTISYLGFNPFSTDVSVGSGPSANVDAVLQVASVNEEVVVRGQRERGEIEALNREQTSDNIVQVLPADVITSLPNTNIADAVGRLPSVSLERDEGEGKYVQVRGTEPRLTNVTVDGVHLPSPEAVRNVKLDAIPADLVDSVEINKTLSANQEGDAIGGSVNLVTKKATDQPYVTLLAMGGHTPIDGGRNLDQFAGTIGKRFGREKRLGVMLGGSYDWNGRGTDDVEPVLGEHVHPPDQQLAARPGADHQHPLGADASAPQPGLVLAQEIALGRHQDGGEQHGLDEGQAGIALPEVAELDRGQDQDRRQPDPAVEAEQLLRQRRSTPGRVLALDGEREQVENDDHRHRR